MNHVNHANRRRHGAVRVATCRLASVLATGLMVAQVTHAGTCNTTCPPDLDFSGQVDGGDLGILFGDWGVVASCANFDAGPSGVDGGDLGVLLAVWGACDAMGCPGVGDCCAVHPSNGCSDADCCDSVCFTILDCCETGWDQACVNVANMVCRQCM